MSQATNICIFLLEEVVQEFDTYMKEKFCKEIIFIILKEKNYKRRRENSGPVCNRRLHAMHGWLLDIWRSTTGTYVADSMLNHAIYIYIYVCTMNDDVLRRITLGVSFRSKRS